MILEKSYDISLLIPPDSQPTMLNVQNVNNLKQHIELPNPLPLTH